MYLRNDFCLQRYLRRDNQTNARERDKEREKMLLEEKHLFFVFFSGFYYTTIVLYRFLYASILFLIKCKK